MKIPILRLPFEREDKSFIQEALGKALDAGSLAMGPYTREFEESFRGMHSAAYALSTSSGTSGLELILRGLGIENRSVVVPTNTFMATAFSVLNTSNRVIFADADPKTLCLTASDLESRIQKDTAAVILVHIGGIVTPEVFEILELCRRKGIVLIEDCAHAHGCRIDERSAGTLGIAGAFSFFPTKVLTTGEGGMVLTNDGDLAKRMRIIRNHGKDPECGNAITEIGANFRMSEITAIVGVRQTRRSEAIYKERRRIARVYDQALSGIEGIGPVRLAESVYSTYYKYIAYLDSSIDRDGFKRLLAEKYGVALTGEVYARLCHKEPLWKRHADRLDLVHEQEFPGAEFVSQHHICLPVYPSLTPDECTYVVESLLAALKESGKCPPSKLEMTAQGDPI